MTVSPGTFIVLLTSLLASNESMIPSKTCSPLHRNQHVNKDLQEYENLEEMKIDVNEPDP
jgi:hypothetical protein